MGKLGSDERASGEMGLNPYHHLLLCAYAKVQHRQNDTCFVSFRFPFSLFPI